jgi:predicted RNase H-like HicB family nuclease
MTRKTFLTSLLALFGVKLKLKAEPITVPGFTLKQYPEIKTRSHLWYVKDGVVTYLFEDQQGMDEYSVFLQWSNEDQARAPELRGCMADGATMEAALANLGVVAEEWIKVAKEEGRPIPHPGHLRPIKAPEPV